MNPNLSDLEITYCLGFFLCQLGIWEMECEEWSELTSDYQIMKSRSIDDLF